MDKSIKDNDYIRKKINKMNPLFTTKELLLNLKSEINEDEYKYLEKNLKKLNISMLIYDEKGHYSTCLYSTQNRIFAQHSYPAIVKLGKNDVNAMAKAYSSLQSSYVCAVDHTDEILYSYTSYASPIINDKKILGSIYILDNNTKLDENILEVINLIANVLSESRLAYKLINHMELFHLILDATSEAVYEGVAFIDENTFLHGYNEKMLKVFGIDKKEADFRNTLVDTLKKIGVDIHKTLNKKIVRYKNKALLASSRKIYLDGLYQGSFVTIIAQDDINKIQKKFYNAILTYKFEHIIYKSEKMKALIDLAKKISRTESPVLINGESGTGKELLAQSIHQESSRQSNPFVAINCGAMPENLIESELFGYEAGAFTGALKNGRKGKMEYASGGTIFLDEIESMPLSTQVKLLRVLSTQTISKVGSLIEIPIDIRVIASTKKDLLELAKKGEFREDLYYRLQVIELTIPPLRERKDDIPLIVNNMLDNDFAQMVNYEFEVSDGFYEVLKSYDWPGNVRELRNTIERCLLLDEGSSLSISNLNSKIKESYLIKDLINNATDGQLYKEFELKFLEFVVNEKDGNYKEAASALGISRQTLYRKLKWSVTN